MRRSSTSSVSALLFTALALLAPVGLVAQIAVSDTIRWENAGAYAFIGAAKPALLRGIVIRRDLDIIDVRLLPGGDTVQVPFVDLDHVEVLRGSRRRGWQAVSMGALFGAGIGGGLGLASGDTGKGDMRVAGALTGLAGGIVGAAFGIMIGGVMAVVTHVDNWQPAAASPRLP